MFRKHDNYQVRDVLVCYGTERESTHFKIILKRSYRFYPDF